MTVEEIRKLLPEAEVFALSPEFNYIITFDMNLVQRETMKAVGESLYKQGIWAALVGVCGPDAINVFRVPQ